jgi:peptide chain release factor subunit 3
MDDPTINWDQARYEAITDKSTPYLFKKCGLKSVEETVFMPYSGLTGAILEEHSREQNLS